MPTGIKFIPSLVNGISTVGVGLSTIVGPTGPAGAFGGPQGFQGIIGPQGMSPTGTNYGDYLYWNGTGSFVVGDVNVNLGSKSGEQSVGLYNVAIGYNAGFTGGFSSGDPFASTATGTSIAIGYYAGYEQACNSIAIGNNAGYFQDFNNIAIGSSAGYLQNEINNIAIGIGAGANSQGTGGNQYGQGGNSIAIGSSSGLVLQGYESVAIGYYAAENRQGHNSVAIGTNAGEFSQGNFSVAIGTNAGVNNQANESIIINASSSSTLDASTSGLFINPIRNAGLSQTLFYDPSTKEITYYSTGSNGPQGPQGLAGSTGADGSQGNQGNQGNQGLIGSTGADGLQGFQGFQGLIGSTGAVGNQGFQGLIGSTGAVGNQGFQGFQGLKGDLFTGPFTDITFSGNMSGANAYLQNLAAENFASQGAIIGFGGLTVVGPTNLISPLNATGGLTTTSATITDLIVSGNVTLPAGYLDSQVEGKPSQFIFNNNGQATGSFNALYFTGTSTGTNIYAGSSFIPSEDSLYNLGSPDHLWKSIYISTGTIFIGPTGTLGLNNNGVISSSAGFSTPFLTIGSTTPGDGINLYTQGDKLFFQNQFGASGAVSIWNVASNNINNTFFTGGNIGI
jgi:hypothetical protein